MANTLKQIAEKCGVSSMTVSRALRHQGPVKEATREKILAVAKLFGYLHGGRPGRPPAAPDVRPVVEVVLGSVGRRVPAFYLELLTAIEQCLAVDGHDCVIRTCNGEYTQVLALRDALRRCAAIGVIIIGDFQPEPLAALLGVSPPRCCSTIRVTRRPGPTASRSISTMSRRRNSLSSTCCPSGGNELCLSGGRPPIISPVKSSGVIAPPTPPPAWPAVPV